MNSFLKQLRQVLRSSMNRTKAILLILLLVELLLVAVLSHYNSSIVEWLANPNPISFQDQWRTQWGTYWREHSPLPFYIQVTVSGPTGTPVMVGCRVDGTREEVIRGVLPTHFSVRARPRARVEGARVQVVVKNLGSNMPGLAVSFTGLNISRPSGAIGPGNVAPFYGGFFDTASYHMARAPVNPDDWPVTLPPGMSAAEARTHDFGRELLLLQLQDRLARLAKSPQDQELLVEVGRLNFALKNREAAEQAFQEFFAADCNDANLLNNAVFLYVNNSGTNLERAYELALKAQALRPGDGDIADTVAWIQIRRGYYRAALSKEEQMSRGGPTPDHWFWFKVHSGIAHYMLLEEGPAQRSFLEVMQEPGDSPEKQEANRYLAILNRDAKVPIPELVSKLKARLTEAPDDPVALRRLSEIFQQAAAEGKRPADPLVLKALGVSAYWHGDYSRAADYLAESVKGRATDGELFLYFGLACKQLQQTNRCADSLRTAKALGLKAAQIEQADAALADRPNAN